MIYPSAQRARTELLAQGYYQGSLKPSDPGPWPWAKPGTPDDRKAIMGNNRDGWQIVPYPALDWLA